MLCLLMWISMCMSMLILYMSILAHRSGLIEILIIDLILVKSKCERVQRKGMNVDHLYSAQEESQHPALWCLWHVSLMTKMPTDVQQSGQSRVSCHFSEKERSGCKLISSSLWSKPQITEETTCTLKPLLKLSFYISMLIDLDRGGTTDTQM